MNPIRIIGDRETVLAFALGGVPGQVATSAAEARAAVESVARECHEAGGPVRHPQLLLVTRGTARLIREYLDRVALDASAPLILEIPGFGEAGGGSPVERFVERVLGVHL